MNFSWNIVLHVIKKGESLAKIAEKYDMTPAQLKKLNGLKSDKLTAGESLVVKAGKTSKEADDNEKPAVKQKKSKGQKLAENDESNIAPKKKGKKAVADEESIAPKKKGKILAANDEDALPAKGKKKAVTKEKTHKIEKGESLYTIADKYGMSVNELKKINNISSNKVKIGQKIKVTN